MSEAASRAIAAEYHAMSRIPTNWWEIGELAGRCTGVLCGLAAEFYFAWNGQWGDLLLAAAVLSVVARE